MDTDEPDLTDAVTAIHSFMESEKCADPVARYLGLDGEWRSGVRPANVIESPADLEWLFLPHPSMTDVVCRWCGANATLRNMSEATRWWNSHPCAEGLAA